MKRFGIGIAALALLATACASTSATPLGESARSKGATYWVENHGSDKRDLQRLIATALQARGLQASSGHRNTRPEDVDFVVTYEDRWRWDMRTYLYELTITVEEANSGEVVGTSRSFQPSLAAMGRSYDEIVRTTTYQLIDGVP